VSGILQLPAVTEMSALRAAFPAYQFRIVMLGDRRRYEAVLRRDAIGSIYCLISVNPREIYVELIKSPGLPASLNSAKLYDQ
jgi:hypothetical protein